MDRQNFLQQAATETFDICIIGGGATGAGCALDAQSRGLKTILVEQEDFGAATSSKSTKLIHGGVRYLEQAVKKLSLGQFRMVRKALKERRTLLGIAPHITRPLQLVTPCSTWMDGLYYFVGLKIYDWISGRTNIGGSRFLKRREAIRLIPTLRKKELYCAVSYYDGQLDDQRFNLALVQTAASLGAVCINHCKVSSFIKNGDGVIGKLVALTAVDRLTGKQYIIRSKVFVNATGPFSDAVRVMANANAFPRIRVSKGVHILLPMRMMPSEAALLIPKTKDGRLVFAIPYQGRLLVGTTDDEALLTTEEFGPNSAEVGYLLDYVNQYLNVNAKPVDVLAGFGGLRPLIMAEAGSTKDLVRDHEVEVDESSGLISILGGKWTTYRLMAKDTVDASLNQMNKKVTACVTDNLPLAGSKYFQQLSVSRFQEQTGWEDDIVSHLVAKYGDNVMLIAASLYSNPEWKTRIHPEMPFTLAELQYVLKKEMACTVKDVLCRRWGIQLADWKKTLNLIPMVGKLMGDYFNWDSMQRQLYIADYANEVVGMMDSVATQNAVLN